MKGAGWTKHWIEGGFRRAGSRSGCWMLCCYWPSQSGCVDQAEVVMLAKPKWLRCLQLRDHPWLVSLQRRRSRLRGANHCLHHRPLQVSCAWRSCLSRTRPSRWLENSKWQPRWLLLRMPRRTELSAAHDQPQPTPPRLQLHPSTWLSSRILGHLTAAELGHKIHHPSPSSPQSVTLGPMRHVRRRPSTCRHLKFIFSAFS